MNSEAFDFLDNLSGTWSVLLGALLATGGGLVSTHLERRLERQSRERNAALLFAEVLSMLGILLDLTYATYKIGEPFGPVTIRMLRSARREIDIYDRNREALFDISDASLRAKIHSIVLRLSMPMDSIFDATNEIGADQMALKSSPNLSEIQRQELEAHMTDLRGRRESSYEFVRETAEELKPVITRLEPIAQQSFANHDQAVKRDSSAPVTSLLP